MIYGYGRHSTDRQGLTEEAQRVRVEQYIALHLHGRTGMSFGGWLYDTAVSRRTPMFERPKGRELWALVQPGDHIVVAKLDRAFGKTIDGLRSLEMLSAKGVHFHSSDRQVDTSTPIGRACLSVVLAFSQLDREQTSERTKEALAVKKRAGLPYGPGIPIGWKKIGQRKHSRFVPDQQERDQAFTIAGLRAGGWSYDRIVDHFWSTRRPNGRRWNRNTVRAAELAAAAGFPKTASCSRAPAEAVPERLSG